MIQIFSLLTWYFYFGLYSLFFQECDFRSHILELNHPLSNRTSNVIRIPTHELLSSTTRLQIILKLKVDHCLRDGCCRILNHTVWRCVSVPPCLPMASSEQAITRQKRLGWTCWQRWECWEGIWVGVFVSKTQRMLSIHDWGTAMGHMAKGRWI